MKLVTPPTLRPGDANAHVVVWQLHGLVPRGLLHSSQVTGVMDKASVAATRAYQKAHMLHVDGIVGPLTWGFAGFVKAPGAMVFPRLPVRRKAVRGVILHHTVTRAVKAAEPAEVDRRTNLRARSVLVAQGLSTDAIIGPYGRTDRTSDPETQRTRHAGAYNERWLGVDLCNPTDEDVSHAFDDTIWATDTAPFAPASDGRRYHPDTDAALYALDKLLQEWCETFGIPYRCPVVEHTIVGADPETLPPGVYAHGHVSDNRWDGHGALRRMRDMGIGPRWEIQL